MSLTGKQISQMVDQGLFPFAICYHHDTGESAFFPVASVGEPPVYRCAVCQNRKTEAMLHFLNHSEALDLGWELEVEEEPRRH